MKKFLLTGIMIGLTGVVTLINLEIQQEKLDKIINQQKEILWLTQNIENYTKYNLRFDDSSATKVKVSEAYDSIAKIHRLVRKVK